MGIRRPALDELLVRRGADPGRVSDARVSAERSGQDLTDTLARAEGVDGKLVTRSLSEISGLHYLESVDIDALDPALIQKVPLGLAREQGILPLWARDGTIEIAISNPKTLASLDALRPPCCATPRTAPTTRRRARRPRS